MHDGIFYTSPYKDSTYAPKNNCPLIQNDGCYLLCKMADDRGVFPGQWALSGGGVEPGERIEEAGVRLENGKNPTLR